MLGNFFVCGTHFVFSANGAVYHQTIPYAKHTENFAQQSDLFAAVNAVCQQTIPYAEHTENAAQQPELFASAVFATQTFLTVCKPLLTDNYCVF